MAWYGDALGGGGHNGPFLCNTENIISVESSIAYL